MDKCKRLTISVPERELASIDKLKKEKFYNQSYADLYRYLLSLGLECAARKERSKCTSADSLI